MTDTGLIQVSTSASYAELREAEDRIKEQLAKVAAEARADALSVIVSSIKEFGFTAEELNDAIEGKVRKAKTGKPSKTKTSVSGAPKERKTVEPKYHNPADTTQTWSGRGVAPAWIKDVAKEDRVAYLIHKAEAAPVGNGVENAPEAEPAATAPASSEPTPSIFDEA